MKQRSISYLLVAGAVTVCASCGGDSAGTTAEADATTQSQSDAGTAEPLEALVVTETLEPGADCTDGGTRVSVGLDTNADGTLSADEIGDGGTMFVCTQGSGCTGEAVEVSGVTGLDARFIDGIAGSISVEGTFADEANITVLAPGFDVEPGDTATDFTLTPQSSGGPFALAAIADDGCTVDVFQASLDAVDPNIATVRGVKAYASGSDIFREGTGGTLFTLESFSASQPTFIDVGDAEVVIEPALGDTSFQLPLDLVLDDALTIVTFADGTLGSYTAQNLAIEDDMSTPASGARVRVINVNLGSAESSARVFGTTTTFENLGFGQAAPAQDVPAGGFVLAVDLDGDGVDDRGYVFDGPVFEEGSNANVFLAADVDTLAFDTTVDDVALVQYLNAAGSSELGTEVAVAPIDFEDDNLPLYVQINSGTNWFLDDSFSSTGAQSIRSGSVNAGAVSELEMTVAFPEDGTLEFDWRLSGFFLEPVYFCLPAQNPCDRYYNTEMIRVTVNGGTIDWTTVSVPVTAGVHTLRWGFDSVGYRPDPINYGGWVDNLRFTPGTP